MNVPIFEKFVDFYRKDIRSVGVNVSQAFIAIVQVVPIDAVYLGVNFLAYCAFHFN